MKNSRGVDGEELTVMASSGQIEKSKILGTVNTQSLSLHQKMDQTPSLWLPLLSMAV